MWKTRSHFFFQSSCCRMGAPAVPQADVKPMSLLQSQHQWKGWEYDGFKSLGCLNNLRNTFGIFSKPVDLWIPSPSPYTTITTFFWVEVGKEDGGKGTGPAARGGYRRQQPQFYREPIALVTGKKCPRLSFDSLKDWEHDGLLDFNRFHRYNNNK